MHLPPDQCYLNCRITGTFNLKVTTVKGEGRSGEVGERGGGKVIHNNTACYHVAMMLTKYILILPVFSLSCVFRCPCLLSRDAVVGVVHAILFAHTLSSVDVN